MDRAPAIAAMRCKTKSSLSDISSSMHHVINLSRLSPLFSVLQVIKPGCGGLGTRLEVMLGLRKVLLHSKVGTEKS